MESGYNALNSATLTPLWCIILYGIMVSANVIERASGYGGSFVVWKGGGVVNMNERQKAFADNFLKYGNAAQAAREAGYSEKYAGQNADKLLKNTNVKQYIDERLAIIESEKIASADEVMKYLTAVMRGETQSEIVVVEGIGEGCSVARHVTKAPDESDRLKAAGMLAKRYGLQTMNVNVKEIKPVVISDDITE